MKNAVSLPKVPRDNRFFSLIPIDCTFQDPNTTEQAALKIQTAYKAMKQRKERERMGKMNGNNTSVISMWIVSCVSKQYLWLRYVWDSWCHNMIAQSNWWVGVISKMPSEMKERNNQCPIKNPYVLSAMYNDETWNAKNKVDCKQIEIYLCMYTNFKKELADWPFNTL